MRLIEYQELARRFANVAIPREARKANWALGLAGESGEVADLLKKALFHGHSLDVDELEKELGDVLWYIANLAYEYGISLEAVAHYNVKKLRKRYPEGFSRDASINREE